MPVSSGCGRRGEIEDRERAAFGSHCQPLSVLRPGQGRYAATIAGAEPDGPALAIRGRFANRDAAVIEPGSNQGTSGMDRHLHNQPADALADFDWRLTLRPGA